MSSAERSPPDTSSAGRAADTALLSAARLFKYYGPQAALQDVSFALDHGEILAVVGENGAGKSTLSKILAGVVQPDSGSLTLRGQSLRLRSPREAIEAGMSYIPQELEYLPNLTVADNLLVGRWPNRRGFTNRQMGRAQAQRLADKFGISLDVRRPITEMGLAERQLVEILKALARRRASSSSTSPPRRSRATRARTSSEWSGVSRMRRSASYSSRTGSTRSSMSPTASSCCATESWPRNGRRSHDATRADPGHAWNGAPRFIGEPWKRRAWPPRGDEARGMDAPRAS